MATMRAKSICNAPSCGRLIDAPGYCAKHAHIPSEYQKQKDKLRGNANERGYSSQWRKARLGYLAKHPLCVICQDNGRIVAGNVVDHVIPHKGEKSLFWDSANWQTLCKPCHDRKTAKDNGGFGNKIKNESE